MDPDATLADMEWTLRDNPEDHDLLESLAEALAQWLHYGGFEPDWRKAPRATEYFRALMTAD